MSATRGFLMAIVIAGCTPSVWAENADFREAATKLFPALVVVEWSADPQPMSDEISDWFPEQPSFDLLVRGREGANSIRRFQPLQPQQQRPVSGWIVADGLVLATGLGRTGDVVWVHDQSGLQHEGKIVATDHVTRLIAIQTAAPLAAALTINEGPLTAGQPVLVAWLANPDEPIASHGMIASGPSSREADRGWLHFLDIRGSHDLAGAPIVNIAGELAGVTVAADQRLACIPASALQPLIESAESDSPQDLWPGRVGIVFSNVRDPLIREVQPSSPASEAGLQVNDRITAVNDVATNSPHAVRAAIAAYRGGDRVTLTIRRGNEDLQQDVVLEADTSTPRSDAMTSMPKMFWRYENGELVPFGPEASFRPIAPAGEDLRKRIPAQPHAPLPPVQLRGLEVERSVLEQSIQSLESQLKTLREQQGQLENQLRSLQENSPEAGE